MNIEINKSLKVSLIPLLCVSILALATLFYLELSSTKVKEIKTAVYTWQSKGKINYNIKLKPNILYSSDTLDEGEVYLSEFVNYIQADFKYDYSGEREAAIKGKYSITSAVEGYIEEANNYAAQPGQETQKKPEPKVVWRKEYKLIPETPIDQKARGINLEKNISLNYSDYNDYAQKVIDFSKYKVSTRLIVTMNVTVQVQTDKGFIEDTSAQSLEFALGGAGFNIIKNEQAEKPGSIEVVKNIRIPPNKYYLAVYGVAAGIFLLVLLFFIIFTRSAPTMDEQLRLINKIFKRYSNRMAVLCGELRYDGSCLRHVRTMEDLVRLADEMQKPVIYKFSENIANITQFFVFDGNWTYLFDLKAFLSPYNREHEYSRPEFVSRPASSSSPGTGSELGAAE